MIHFSIFFSLCAPYYNAALASMPALIAGAPYLIPFLFFASIAYVHILSFPFTVEKSAD